MNKITKLFRCCKCLDEGYEGIYTWKNLIKHKHKLQDYWFVGNPEVYRLMEMEIPKELW